MSVSLSGGSVTQWMTVEMDPMSLPTAVSAMLFLLKWYNTKNVPPFFGRLSFWWVFWLNSSCGESWFCVCCPFFFTFCCFAFNETCFHLNSHSFPVRHRLYIWTFKSYSLRYTFWFPFNSRIQMSTRTLSVRHWPLCASPFHLWWRERLWRQLRWSQLW